MTTLVGNCSTPREVSTVAELHRTRGAFVAALVIGLGLIAAPAVFQMFSRAPGGGEMLNDFAPYMTTEVIGGFADDLALIRTAIAGLR